MSRQLARAVVWGGGGAAPAPPLVGSGRFCASSIRLAKKNARCPGLPEVLRRAWPGWLSYAACSREGQEEQSRCFLARLFLFSRRLWPVDEHGASWPCSNFMAHVASDVAISRHLPLFTQGTRQGLEKKWRWKNLTAPCSGDCEPGPEGIVAMAPGIPH
jgi:hypothetical protein